MLERVSKMFDKMIAKEFYFLVCTFGVEGDFFFFFFGLLWNIYDDIGLKIEHLN